MKALKKILLGILIFIGVLIIVGSFMPSTIELERSRVIKAPIEMIYDQVNNLHLWEHWSPWHKIDPNMKISYANGGIGKDASYSWTSDHGSVGNGTLTITDAKPFEYIKTQMDFGEQGMGTAGFTFEAMDEGVKVSWDMKSDLGKNPFMKLMGIVMKKSINGAYDRGLTDIENQCEFLKENAWYYVKLKEKEGFSYYGISAEGVTTEDVGSVMESAYTTIAIGLAQNEIENSGSAFALYHTWGASYNMECAFPVKDNTKAIKGLEQKNIPTHKYAALKYTGDYSDLESAHGYLMDWIKKYGYELAGPVMEKYKVGPSNENNPEQWITYILYPIK